MSMLKMQAHDGLNRDGNPAKIIHLNGELNDSTSPLLKECLKKMLEDGYHTYQFDCTRLIYIDATGLMAFVGLKREVLTKNGKVIIVDIDEKLMRIFTITGLINCIECYPVNGQPLAEAS